MSPIPKTSGEIGPGDTALCLRQYWAWIQIADAVHSCLRMVWQSSVFAKMAKDMPPVFFADYAAQEADRALKLKEELPIDAWDLTDLLLSEVSIDGGMEMAKTEVDTDEERAPKRRSDSPVEERQTKRKRPSGAGRYI